MDVIDDVAQPLLRARLLELASDDDEYARWLRETFFRSLPEEPWPTFRMVMVGDSGVGKTSLMCRACFVDPELVEETPTIGAEPFYPEALVKGRELRFQAWDISGQPKFHGLLHLYTQKANGGMVVYDVSNRRSYNSAKRWVEYLRDTITTIDTIVLVGNKLDLLDDNCQSRAVSFDEAKRFATEMDISFIETSAVSGRNRHECFRILGSDLLYKLERKLRLQSHKETLKRKMRLLREQKLLMMASTPKRRKSSVQIGETKNRPHDSK